MNLNAMLSDHRWLFLPAAAALLIQGAASACAYAPRPDGAGIPSSPPAEFVASAQPIGELRFTLDPRIGLFAAGDPINGMDPDGRLAKGGAAAGWEAIKGAAGTVYDFGGTLGFGALNLVGQKDLAWSLYGDQAQRFGGIVFGAANLGGTALDALGGERQSQAALGQMGIGMLSGFTADDGGHSMAYRFGYTFVNVASVVGVGEAALGKVSLGAADDVARLRMLHPRLNPAEAGMLNLTAAKKPPIIIGENMDRVKAYVEQFGGQAYRPWKLDPWDEATAMRRNERWIQDQRKAGRKVIDIGPDFGRRESTGFISDFYEMERRNLRDYENYRKVFERSGSTGGVPGLDF